MTQKKENKYLGRILFFILSLVLTIENASSQVDFEEGLVGYYPFNGDANDLSVHLNHGTAINVISTPDRFGVVDKAYDFNGGNAYISINSSESLESPVNELSQVAWIYGNLGNAFSPVIMKSESASNAFQYRMYVATNRIGTSVNNWNNGVINSVPISSGKWHLIVSTFKDGIVTGYLDGLFINSVTMPGVTTIFLDMHNLEIGRDVPGTTEYFNGKIDDVRIYNRAINAEEVMALFDEGNYQEIFKDSFEFSL